MLAGRGRRPAYPVHGIPGYLTDRVSKPFNRYWLSAAAGSDSLDDLEIICFPMPGICSGRTRQDLQDDQLEEHPLTNIADNAELKGCPSDGKWQARQASSYHKTIGRAVNRYCVKFFRHAGCTTALYLTRPGSIRTANPVNAILKQYPVLGQLLEGSFTPSKRMIIKSHLFPSWGRPDNSLHHEEQEEERLPLDEETLKKIIEDAKQLLLEGLAEEGRIMRIKRTSETLNPANQTLEDLHPGLVIVGGCNRAGKSTFMQVLQYLGYVPSGGSFPCQYSIYDRYGCTGGEHRHPISYQAARPV